MEFNYHKSSQNTASSRWVIGVIGGVSALLGILVMIGWQLHLTTLIQWRPTLAPMQFNTALCFVLAGVALCFYAATRIPLAASALGAIVLAISGLTLGEYLLRADFRIDQLFFRAYITTETSNIGRMSPVSALCLSLAGLALVLLGAPYFRGPKAAVVGSLASIIISISLVALLGYAFGLSGTYGWGQLTRVATHTAAGLGLLGIAIFTAAWRLGLQPAERTARWLPLPIALGIFTATLVLYFALDHRQDEDIRKTVQGGAESVKGQILLRAEGRMRALVRMAHRWEFSGRPAQAEWEDDARNHLRDFPDLQDIAWVDDSFHVRWDVPAENSDAKLHLGLIEEPRCRAAADQARQEHKAMITPALPLLRGGQGFMIFVPLQSAGKSDGWISVTITAQTMFERYFPAAVAPGEALRISEAGHLLWERTATAPSAKQYWVVENRAELSGTAWDIRVWPTPELGQRLDDPLPELVFLAGGFGAVLCASICALAQRASRRSSETSRANQALQAALDDVKTLEGLLPICASCKRVRDDTGYWNQIESYVSRRTRASFSHGYCPECAVKAFVEFGVEVPQSLRDELAAHQFD